MITNPPPGAVVVPDALTGAIWRALASEIRRRRIEDGSTRVAPEMLAFLEALRRRATADHAPTSPSGSAVADPGRLLLTASDVALVVGCSPRWARVVIQRAGGSRVGRLWLIDAETLDHWRHPC